MDELLLFLNQPTVLMILGVGAVVLVLIDYLFPVDWPAFVGYVLFSVFVGATVPLSQTFSLIVMGVTFVVLLILHAIVFSKYLTNAPYCYRCSDPPESERNEGDTIKS